VVALAEMSTRRQIDRAREVFETFHDKPSGERVYPFVRKNSGEWTQDVLIAPMRPVGEAVRVMYRSDKWHRPGKTTDYYHDHAQGHVRLWLPCEEGERARRFPHSWPDAVAVLGQCTAWYFTADGQDDVTEHKPRGALLAASPYGHVDATAPQRVFLAVVHSKTGDVLALIEGQGLRLTSHGIEG
jgi:hypothetical protein